MNQTNYKNRREKLLNNIGNGECFFCHKDSDLHCHHVFLNGCLHGIGGTKGLKQLEKDWDCFLNGDMEKLLLILCKDCHIKIHDEKIVPYDMIRLEFLIWLSYILIIDDYNKYLEREQEYSQFVEQIN